jgi:hypothetical protein
VSILIVIGLPLFWVGCRNLWRAFTSPNWPKAPGVVLQSEVLENVSIDSRNRSRSRNYSAGIVVGYSVNGRDYTSDAVYAGRTAGSSDSSEAEMLHFRYAQGAAVTVFHSPADPSIAALEPGFQSSVLWFPGMGLAWLVPGVAFWLVYLSTRVPPGWVDVCGNLIAAGLVLTGAAMLADGVQTLWLGRSSQSWPVASGVIICAPQKPPGAAIPDDEDQTVPGSASRSTGLVYQYEVMGMKHFGRLRRFGDMATSGGELSIDIARLYPVGTSGRVAYSSADPDIAVLDPGVFSDAYWIPGLGGVLLLLGVGIYLFAISALRQA